MSGSARSSMLKQGPLWGMRQGVITRLGATRSTRKGATTNTTQDWPLSTKQTTLYTTINHLKMRQTIMYKWDMHTVMWKPLRLAFQYEQGTQDGWLSLLFYFKVTFWNRGQYCFLRGPLTSSLIMLKLVPYSCTVVPVVLSSLFWLKYSAWVLSSSITSIVQLLVVSRHLILVGYKWTPYYQTPSQQWKVTDQESAACRPVMYWINSRRMH